MANEHLSSPRVKAALRAGIAAFAALAALLVLGPLWWGGMTPRQAARILFQEDKFAGRSVAACKFFGNRVLPHLRAESQDFRLLNSRNAFRLVEVLGGIHTPASRALLEELYARPGDLPKLAAAAGLAAHSRLPGPIDDSSLLVQYLQGRRQEVKGDAGRQLAALALGSSGRKEAVPYLAREIERPAGDYWLAAYLAQGLGALGDPAAIPALRHSLARADFHALSPAFRALMLLGDRDAVPLAITRLASEQPGSNVARLLDDMQLVTGQRHDLDRRAWDAWWADNKASWQIPLAAIAPWA